MHGLSQKRVPPPNDFWKTFYFYSFSCDKKSLLRSVLCKIYVWPCLNGLSGIVREYPDFTWFRGRKFFCWWFLSTFLNSPPPIGKKTTFDSGSRSGENWLVYSPTKKQTVPNTMTIPVKKTSHCNVGAAVLCDDNNHCWKPVMRTLWKHETALLERNGGIPNRTGYSFKQDRNLVNLSQGN